MHYDVTELVGMLASSSYLPGCRMTFAASCNWTSIAGVGKHSISAGTLEFRTGLQR